MGTSNRTLLSPGLRWVLMKLMMLVHVMRGSRRRMSLARTDSDHLPSSFFAD